jgi:Xaa-Pro aminopeptidase
LLVSPGGSLLVSDGRYTQQIEEECKGLVTYIRPPSIRVTAAAADALKKLGWRDVGFESSHLTVAEWQAFKEMLPSVNWKPCEGAVEKLRVCKDPSEVAEIREAIAMAERAFRRFRSSLRPADTEKRLSDRMEMLLRDEGGKCSSFPTIVAVGERAALPHCPPSQRTLAEAELVLVDWGASGRFYKSDLTRVLATRRISPKLEQVYEVVLRAQTRAINKIRPGIQAQEVDAEARGALEEAGFGDFFSHATGHGIGLDIHEAPRLGPQIETILEAGMVVTVEPGVYLPDWGGVRLEDDVLITPDGCAVLTSVPKDLRLAMIDL